MHIVIHVGGIPFNGDTVKERSLGGSESAAYYTAKELAQRGHRVVVFTEHEDSGVFDNVTYLWMGNRTQVKPLGENWHFYCEHTPHEVNIVQRQPGGLMFHIQSKINLWWAHDIALKRNNSPFMAQLWQTDRVLPVSHWFKDQIGESWLCDPDLITPIHNGVDYSMFEQFELKDNTQSSEEITLIYSSRPERGLVNLVDKDGIMEQLLEKAPHVKLKVCGYEHPVPSLDNFYTYLRERCDELPNVEHLGQLTKQELCEIQCTQADVWCYPTEFEEVSCITAMEAMAAGMYILTTNTAALPETLGDYENITRFNYDEDVVDKFVDFLTTFDNQYRRRPFREYTWARVADEFEEVIADCFGKYTSDVDGLARHYLHNSDIIAFDKLAKDYPEHVDISLVREYNELYCGWAYDPKAYATHYADGTEEMYDGPNFTYESDEFVNHPRFSEVARWIERGFKDDDVVLDYGCAHGHFTNYLAQKFPNINFIGIDVSPKAIAVAKHKAAEMKLTNVNYLEQDWLDKHRARTHPPCDGIILGEILEHVPDPVKFMEVVYDIVGDVKVIVTTPIGPWESLSYQKDYPKRFHLHHIERSDLDDLFGHHEKAEMDVLPATHTEHGELLGWYITRFKFTKDNEPARPIDYGRKLRETAYKQTVSFCMIVKDGEADLLKMLRSVEPYVDEMIIGVDEGTTDRTEDVIKSFAKECLDKHRSPQLSIQQIDIPSPVDIGFDAARNLTIEKATKHWVMWADSDEQFICGERLPKYLRQNGWQGYGIPQHHFSTEPTAVLSTDYPVRIFRRNDDVRFRGVVHEHPENKNKPDDGVGYAYVLFELHFSHNGYSTEPVRRKRFMRNIALMARDREENPDRILGKFLWIRDLALMCRFELEQTGGVVTPEMHGRAVEGLKLWEETLDKCSDHPQVRRMIKDHLEFYDTLVKILGEGFTFKMNITSGNGTADIHLNGVGELSAQFLNRRHLDKFLSVVIDDEVKDYGTKYH
jgi:glycosyltransferase involved in cell wall biosynthesis/2-polyprenyl-3-methyl-5-hydroxy-6-metoxy-1,4-benzoquinol methylase